MLFVRVATWHLIGVTDLLCAVSPEVRSTVEWCEATAEGQANGVRGRLVDGQTSGAE